MFKIEKSDIGYTLLTDQGAPIGSFEVTDGGYYGYYGLYDKFGYYTSASLKEIAALLDEVNKPWQDAIDEYFKNADQL